LGLILALNERLWKALTHASFTLNFYVMLR